MPKTSARQLPLAQAPWPIDPPINPNGRRMATPLGNSAMLRNSRWGRATYERGPRDSATASLRRFHRERRQNLRENRPVPAPKIVARLPPAEEKTSCQNYSARPCSPPVDQGVATAVGRPQNADPGMVSPYRVVRSIDNAVVIVVAPRDGAGRRKSQNSTLCTLMPPRPSTFAKIPPQQHILVRVSRMVDVVPFVHARSNSKLAR